MLGGMLILFAKSLEPLQHQILSNLCLSHSELYMHLRDKNFGKLTNLVVRDMALELKGLRTLFQNAL